ncbi:hypothetical protein BT93_L2884 [Corymbia citriodora subsp. variegata]|uniref:DUF4220 domain-containing protein n=1 Tax=Corymbia citriodora subsp. variegata TaxID=360336 RepID=A0A8T0CMX4_CORYI|nr:hypothetical protein BT93_L2884 [Corymbia citriodora subsp. variegata]
MGVVNKTLDGAKSVMKNFSTPKASLAKVEFLVVLTAFLQLSLVIFGSWRRRCNNPTLRCLIWAAYTLSSYLIVYTLGLMTEASFQNELLPVWAILLMIFFGSADSCSAYSLEDCEHWRNYAWQFLIKCTGVAILLIIYEIRWPMAMVLFVLFSLVELKCTDRRAALFVASGYGRQCVAKLMADYMSYEHQSSEGNIDPIQMRGYKYVVRGEELILFKRSKKRIAAERKTPSYCRSLKITDGVITIEKVWKCQGWLLRSGGGDEDSKLKDICLSFSLCKLLSLRFSGFSLPKQAHEKLWKLIQHLYGEGNGYERAFKVVEVELSFLFDTFYTNYPIIFLPFRWPVKLMGFLVLIIGSLMTLGLYGQLYISNTNQDEVHLATAGRLSIDFLVTALILIVFICVELVQLVLMAISDWAKVSLLCKYVHNQSWHNSKRVGKLIRLICRTQLLKPWERKLRQYSLLDSYDYTPSRWLHNRFTALYIDHPGGGKKQSTPAKLSSEVKQAVFHSLMSSYPRVLENGRDSLRLNKVEHKLSWACGLETQTQVIIVWHIATSICEHEHRGQISDPNFRVATYLSKYLAYLVAFSSKLLPDHPGDAEYIFYRIIYELRALLEGRNTKEERIQKLKEIGETRDENGTWSVISQGAWLGQQLLKGKRGPKLIWKVLAEFWAELMVYVAPSDNAKAHVEHLAMGGEFMTHLWALVSHAGIKREPLVERLTLNRSQSWPN